MRVMQDVVTRIGAEKEMKMNTGGSFNRAVEQAILNGRSICILKADWEVEEKQQFSVTQKVFLNTAIMIEAM